MNNEQYVQLFFLIMNTKMQDGGMILCPVEGDFAL